MTATIGKSFEQFGDLCSAIGYRSNFYAESVTFLACLLATALMLFTGTDPMFPGAVSWGLGFVTCLCLHRIFAALNFAFWSTAPLQLGRAASMESHASISKYFEASKSGMSEDGCSSSASLQRLAFEDLCNALMRERARCLSLVKVDSQSKGGRSATVRNMHDTASMHELLGAFTLEISSSLVERRCVAVVQGPEQEVVLDSFSACTAMSQAEFPPIQVERHEAGAGDDEKEAQLSICLSGVPTKCELKHAMSGNRRGTLKQTQTQGYLSILSVSSVKGNTPTSSAIDKCYSTMPSTSIQLMVSQNMDGSPRPDPQMSGLVIVSDVIDDPLDALETTTDLSPGKVGAEGWPTSSSPYLFTPTDLPTDFSWYIAGAPSLHNTGNNMQFNRNCYETFDLDEDDMPLDTDFLYLPSPQQTISLPSPLQTVSLIRPPSADSCAVTKNDLNDQSLAIKGFF
eukprot:gene5947-33523_t